MNPIYIPKLNCQWCQKENDFTYGDSKGNPGKIYDLDQKDTNHFVCRHCGNRNQIVVVITVNKFQPEAHKSEKPSGLKKGADVLFGGKS